MPVEESQKRVQKGSLLRVPLILPRIRGLGRGGRATLLSGQAGGLFSQNLGFLTLDRTNKQETPAQALPAILDS